MVNSTLFNCQTVEEAKKLILSGVNVNIININIDSITPLHCVKNPEIAKFLIENGADVNAIDVCNDTPLHYVENLEIAKLLLENGANVNAVDNGGSTPIIGKENPEKISELELSAQFF